MTSLPIAISNFANARTASAPNETNVNYEANENNETNETCKAQEENEQFLLQAFRSFAEAAGSLEHSYGRLRSEVGRLHGDLAQSNAGLERSLEENRRMRRHLDRILDGLPCGVLVEGAHGSITRINPEGRRLLGSIGSGVGTGFGSTLPLSAEMRDLLSRARQAPGEHEQCFKEESGGECWLAVRHAAVENFAEPDGASEPAASRGNGESSEGQVSVFILRDVSEAKRLVRGREKSRREQALAEMSAILAHEIRNPLGSLELFAGLLAGAGLSGECREWVEQVQTGLRTLAATVNNVLHFHCLPEPERAPTDLGQLLDWAGGFLVPMAKQARVQLCLRNRLQGFWFPADRHRLEQVLLNLVLNAIRAMPGGGWIEIGGERGEIRGIEDRAMEDRGMEGRGMEGRDARRVVIIRVSDTGPGIAAGQEEKIFEAGFSTNPGSPGLGLAVCRKIVEQHGGSLLAANRSGSGASFSMTFPLPEKAGESTQE